ncbi:hypothetical protein [Flavobacterium sp.]|uniref:hypothetical protein n=1 Tax=Flavobacterium sp. TaxID=239 RepID=UPI003751251D
MKKKILVMVVFCSLFFSCKKAETKVDNTPSTQVQEVATKECYEYVQGKDTIQANLLVQSQTVSGDLIYKIFEKDKNSGTITGKIVGDTLIADYAFMSEGKKSIREVAFLRKNKSLIEGYGESEEKEGKMIFKDKKKLNFTANMVLNEIPCK